HRERGAHGAEDARGGRHVAHEGGALALAGDAGHGAAHVEIHDVGPQALAFLGGAPERVGDLAEELHRQRPLLRVVRGDVIGVRVLEKQGGGVHLLGGGEPAAAFLHDEPEGGVGDARHGGHAGERADVDGTDLHGSSSIPGEAAPSAIASAGRGYSHAGTSAPCASRRWGAQARATNRIAMSCLVGFSASVSSGARAGSVLAATASVSALSSASRSVKACSRLSTVSLARETSCISFMVRPAPRAAVVARPSVVALTALRPRRAPSTVAPSEMATWRPCWVAWLDSRSVAC